jgi:transcriptional regulator with XRE-family HTH domain
MDLNQTELGRKLGVSGSYISRIERDLVKIQPMVLRLAEALDVSVDYLLGLSSEQDPDAQALARNYAQADEEQLLIWLAETSPELAEIMRAIKEIPDEEQEYILEALARDLAAIQSGQGLGVKGDADA